MGATVDIDYRYRESKEYYISVVAEEVYGGGFFAPYLARSKVSKLENRDDYFVIGAEFQFDTILFVHRRAGPGVQAHIKCVATSNGDNYIGIGSTTFKAFVNSVYAKSIGQVGPPS